MRVRFKAAAAFCCWLRICLTGPHTLGWRAARPPIRSDAMRRSTDTAKRRVALLAGAIALLAALPARAQTAPPPVTATIIGVSVSIWPAIVADQKGFFAEEGVKVDMIAAGARARPLQQGAAGGAALGGPSTVADIPRS